MSLAHRKEILCNDAMNIRTPGALALAITVILGSHSPSLQTYAASGDTLPTGQVSIEQTPVYGNLWSWTLLSTTNTSYTGSKESEALTIPAGSYTLFFDSPKGYTTKMELFLGDTLLKTTDAPQMNFQFDGSLPLRFKVAFTLFYKGKVNVVSTPQGVPFELRGPNHIIQQGVTPQSFPDMPIGQYSVRYLPQGCAATPPRSDELKYEGRVDFSVTLKCDSMHTVEVKEVKEKDAVVITKSSSSSEGKDEQEQDVISPSSFAASVLGDIPAESWFTSYVNDVMRRGIMAGYKNEDGSPSNNFGPQDPLSLAQLAKIAHEIAGIDEMLTMTEPVNLSAYGWMQRYIASAEANDWTVFYDTETDVNRPATRGEVLVTLLQALDVPLNWPKGKMFQDVNRRTPYAGAIETAAQAGIVAGTTDGSGNPTGRFEPLSSVNRAEMAKMVVQAIEEYSLNIPELP